MQPATPDTHEHTDVSDAEAIKSMRPRFVDNGGPSWRTSAALLSCCVLVGAFLRLDFMRAVGFAIDGDEAIVGLMGKHILEGREFPTFYYGQHYMGSLEAIMASVSFALLGVSPFALQLIPLLWSLALIVVLFFLTKSIMNARAGLIAATLMAVAPPGLLVWSSKARGGFIEVVTIGAIAMVVLVMWIRTHPERLRYPIVVGALLGLGWWVNNQIVYFIAPIGIFGTVHSFSRSMRLAGNGLRGGTTVGLSRGVARIVVAGIIGFIVGGAPWWLYNITKGFPSAGMFSMVDWNVFCDHLRGFRQVALPMILGAQRFWQKEPIFPLAKELVICLYVIPVATLAATRCRTLVSLSAGYIDRRRPIELLVLFCLACCGIFALSSFGGLVQAPRYLLPLYVGVFALVAICCELLMQRSARLGGLYLGTLILFQLCASYLGGRAITGEPVVFAVDRVARDHTPLIGTLTDLGIKKIRTNYWIGYRLALETSEGVIFKQIGEPYQVRVPSYETDGVSESEVLPLVLVKAQVPTVTAALKRMGFSFSEASAGEYRVLHHLQRLFQAPRPLRFNFEELKVSKSGPVDAKFAFDGSLSTRWGTAVPQQSGQSFVVELPPGVILDGIRYSIGRWWADRPRELKIELEDPRGVRTVVLSPFEARGAFDLTIGDGAFTVRFEPVETRRVILSQLGNDRVFDWSIAEIEMFGERR